jgi:hypothetical protein
MTSIKIEPFGILNSELGGWGYLVVRNDYDEARMRADVVDGHFRLTKTVDPYWDLPIGLGREKLQDGERARGILEGEAKKYANYLVKRFTGE